MKLTKLRKFTKGAVACTLTLAIALGAGTLAAQQAAFTRTVLQKIDLTAPGREAVQVRAEFPPGAVAGRHTHPGEELIYVIDGTLVLEVEGRGPVTLKAGDVASVPAATVHDGRNIGTGTARVLTTYIVEKGKPLATAAK
jgi:quercetin dioxygenase-like cupin family protein